MEKDCTVQHVNTVSQPEFKKLHDLLSSFPEFERFKELFPRVSIHATDVAVRVVNSSFSFNPKEIKDLHRDLEDLDFLLKESLINPEEHSFYLNQLKKHVELAVGINVYGSVDEETDFVAFRETPAFYDIVTTLARDYFNTGFLFWESMFGGAVILFDKMLKEKIPPSEDLVKNYINLLRATWFNPEDAYRTVSSLLARAGVEVKEFIDGSLLNREEVNLNTSSTVKPEIPVKQKTLLVLSEAATALGKKSQAGKIAWYILVETTGKRFITNGLVSSLIRLKKFEAMQKTDYVNVPDIIMNNERRLYESRLKALKSLQIYDEKLVRNILRESLEREIKLSEETNCFNCEKYLLCNFRCKFIPGAPEDTDKNGPNCYACQKVDECNKFLFIPNKNLICKHFVLKNNSLLEEVVKSLTKDYEVELYTSESRDDSPISGLA